MRPGLVLTMFLALATPAAAEDAELNALKAAVEKARSVEDLAVIARRIEADLPPGRPGFDRLSLLSTKYERLGEVDEARDVLLRNEKRVGQPHLSTLHGRVADLLDRADRTEEAIGQARRALEAHVPDPEGGSAYYLRERLALLNEKLLRWNAALDNWRMAEPGGWCGTCVGEQMMRRRVGMARCRFHQGQHEAALKTLGEIVVDTGSFGGGPQHWALFLELSARADRLEEARRRVETVSEDDRARVEALLGVAEGFRAKDPARILDRYRQEMRSRLDASAWTGRLLRELGESSITAFREGIAAGDENVLWLAYHLAWPETRSALEKRQAVETDRKRKHLIRSALARIPD